MQLLYRFLISQTTGCTWLSNTAKICFASGGVGGDFSRDWQGSELLPKQGEDGSLCATTFERDIENMYKYWGWFNASVLSQSAVMGRVLKINTRDATVIDFDGTIIVWGKISVSRFHNHNALF